MEIKVLTKNQAKNHVVLTSSSPQRSKKNAHLKITKRRPF